MTDWERLRNMTDQEIVANAMSDPDNPPWTEEMFERAIPVYPKVSVSIRLDLDIIEWFKQFGPRYQTRVNAVLREYVVHQRMKSGNRINSRRTASAKK